MTQKNFKCWMGNLLENQRRKTPGFVEMTTLFLFLFLLGYLECVKWKTTTVHFCFFATFSTLMIFTENVKKKKEKKKDSLWINIWILSRKCSVCFFTSDFLGKSFTTFTQSRQIHPQAQMQTCKCTVQYNANTSPTMYKHWRRDKVLSVCP